MLCERIWCERSQAEKQGLLEDSRNVIMLREEINKLKKTYIEATDDGKEAI